MTPEKCLIQFSQWAERYPGPISDSIEIKGETPGPRKLITACVHGDEVGSMPGLLETIKRVSERKWSLKGTVIFALGNPKAILAKKRFLQGDLNRQFSSQRGEHEEGVRATQLQSLLKKVEYHLDLHQTIEPSRHPFYLSENEERSLSLAAYLSGSPYLIEVPAELNKKYGTFMGAAMNEDVAHICLEMYQKGFSDQVTDLTLLHLKKMVDLDESLSLKNNSMESFERLKIVYQEKFDDLKMTLNPGYLNFTEVREGEVIGVNSKSELIKVPRDGFLLFPKYPQRNQEGEVLGELPKSIYELAVKI